MSLRFYKILGALSWPVYRFFPGAYFKLYAFYKRRGESYKIELLSRFVKRASTVVDVGAYIGFYTQALSSLVEKSGKVFAFEPDRLNFKFLQKNTRRLSQVRTLRLAVAAESGTGSLFRSKTLNVDHRMYGGGEHGQPVATISLDDFLQKQGFKPSFIKMDIQGYELEALRGMSQVLRVSKPVILTEFWPWGLRQAGGSAESFLAKLADLGYQAFLVDEKHRTLEPFKLADLAQGEADYYDLVCHV